MFAIKKENGQYLQNHNIRILDLNPPPKMAQPNQKVVQMPKIRMLRGGRPPSTIKITNVKSIKPPDPEILKKQEEVTLRAQLQKEIVSRSRTCAYRGYECTDTVLSGQLYCANHILSDPSAPFKQCAHVFSNGQRCSMLSPPEGRDQRELRDQGLCFEHARIAMAARHRTSAPPPPVTTTESLLNMLQHYIVRPDRTRTTSCASSVSVVSDPAEQEQQISTNPVDPFNNIDAAAVNTAVTTTIMECASDSDSECDSVILGPGGNCRSACDHEPEMADVPHERGALWNAGVYTAEEAIGETLSVLRSLQASYARQSRRLLTLLQVARFEYLKSLRAEKETYCSINSQARSGPLTAKERQQLRKLKAYMNYHKRHGVDAVLARKLHRKRAKANEIGPSRPVPSQTRCVFTEGGVRCDNPGLPAAKHCKKHIMLDKHQVLFKTCGDHRGGTPCKEPVARLPLAYGECRYHAGRPPYTHLTPARSSPKKEEGDANESHSTTDESQIEPLEEASERSAEAPEPQALAHADTFFP